MSNRGVIIAAIVIVPLIYGLLYWQLGVPPPSSVPNTGMSTVSSEGGKDWQASEGRDDVSVRLKTRVEQNPDDGVGWALLARSYVETGRHAEAAPMYEKAVKLLQDDPQVLADYADVLGVLQGRKLEGKAERLIQQALKIDSNNVKALRLAGTAAFDRKEFKQAAQYWERAEGNLAAGTEPEVRREILEAIAEAKALAGGKPMRTGVNAGSLPTGSDGQGRAVSGTVTLAPTLKGKAVLTDTLFVFARQVSGPPMPVAIVRAAKRDLPFTFRLDDSNSPMPARKLSEVGDVVIVARLSKSGEAMPKSGDLEGMSRAVRMGAEKVTVVINRELP